MLKITPITPEHQVILNTCNSKINDIYHLLSLYDDSPDKFWLDYHLKSVMLWLTTVIGTGTIRGGINLAPAAPADNENPAPAASEGEPSNGCE